MKGKPSPIVETVDRSEARAGTGRHRPRSQPPFMAG
jgi:hypothetical protein